MNTQNTLLPVGRVVRAQGLLGEVKIESLMDAPEQWLDIDIVLLCKGTTYEPRRIGAVRLQKGMVFAAVEGVEDRTAAEALCGEMLYLERENIPVEPDSWFIADLVGSEVKTQTGEPVGKLIEVLQSSSCDVYVVKNSKGSQILFPALRDLLVNVDVAQHSIVVDAARLEEVAVRED